MSAGIKRQSERLKKKGKVKPFRKGLVTWQFAQPPKKKEGQHLQTQSTSKRHVRVMHHLPAAGRRISRE